MSLYLERDSKGTTHWVKKTKAASNTTTASTIYYMQRSRYLSYGHPHPSHLQVLACPDPLPFDYLESWLDDEPQFLDPRGLEPQSRRVTNKSKSLENTPNIQQRSPKASLEKLNTDPAIPFVSSPQQLNRTIRLGIIIFNAFHATFRESSDGLKLHAPQALLNNIWQSQIDASKINSPRD
jgi:hypothetical protein